MKSLSDLMVTYYSKKYAELLTQPCLFERHLPPKKDGSDWYKPLLRYGHKGETVAFERYPKLREDVTDFSLPL